MVAMIQWASKSSWVMYEDVKTIHSQCSSVLFHGLLPLFLVRYEAQLLRYARTISRYLCVGVSWALPIATNT